MEEGQADINWSDDSQRMWDRVHHQVGILRLQLNVLQRFGCSQFLGYYCSTDVLATHV